MRLASFAVDGRERFGAVVDGGVVDLTDRLPGGRRTLREVLEADALGDAARLAAAAAPDHALDEVAWRLPVPDPEKIFCVGQNYAAHVREMGYSMPEWPSVFVRFARTFAPHLGRMVMPHASRQLDYEGELAAVIGRPARNVPEAEALGVVAGYTICNDGSVRDWQRRGPQVAPGKNWERSGLLGPWIATADEAGDPADMTLVTRVNGEERQRGRTDDLVFSVAYLVSYLSTFIALAPGDLITTGSPSGVAAGFDPPKWLKPGDEVEIEIDRVGLLRGTVAPPDGGA